MDRPFSDPLFDRLFPPLATGVPWGLDRVSRALADLGDPHRRYATVHVGGTNGKGSVAAILAAVLGAEGTRVGLYTSPHLCSFRERFQVGGEAPSEARLLEAAADIRSGVVEHGLTFFEAATVLAFQLFAREGVEVGVIEVGLGGRLDATNVVRPLVSAVTNVAMDHADYLGDTLEAIAREKAGIIKPGVPFVTAETEPTLLEVFRSACAYVAAPFRALDPTCLRDVEVAADHTGFTLFGEGREPLRLRTPLVGHHQAVNTALALEIVGLLPAEARPGDAEVRTGLEAVRWPGRDQIDRIDGLTWLFDVAHNTAGVRSLVAVLDRLELPRPWVALVGILGDKAWDEMLPPLLREVDGAVLTQPTSAPAERRWDPALAASTVGPTLGPDLTLRTIPDFARALDAARTLARSGTVIVTGSCHTVGDALRLLDRCPHGP